MHCSSKFDVTIKADLLCGVWGICIGEISAFCRVLQDVLRRLKIWVSIMQIFPWHQSSTRYMEEVESCRGNSEDDVYWAKRYVHCTEEINTGWGGGIYKEMDMEDMDFWSSFCHSKNCGPDQGRIHQKKLGDHWRTGIMKSSQKFQKVE